MDIESRLKKLEGIVRQMEDTHTGLEEVLQLYKEGLDIAMGLAQRMAQVEAEITVLNEQADGIFQAEGGDQN